MTAILFVSISSGFGQNHSPVILHLKVIETLQGEQGVKQIIVRGAATDVEDGKKLMYQYQITKGTGVLKPVKRYVILEAVTSDVVDIELKVTDSQGASAVKTVSYSSLKVSPQELYTNEEAWKKAIGKNFFKHPSFTFQKADSSLPNVLLIGNSISIGYTPYVQKKLSGTCNVYRIPDNGGDTQKGIENLKFWLGDTKWDVIHFNFGLHDLKYVKDNTLDLNGAQQIAPETYKRNLVQIVDLLKSTNAQLIWATTSLIPIGAEGRAKGDEVKYNAIALKIMGSNQIQIDDQYALTQKYPEEQRPKNVHFFDEGKERQGQQVATQILNAIKQ